MNNLNLIRLPKKFYYGLKIIDFYCLYGQVGINHTTSTIYYSYGEQKGYLANYSNIVRVSILEKLL